jgi:(2Fe-2S) ferredoxin
VKTKRTPQVNAKRNSRSTANGPEVLTLPEAAAYLRMTEADVLRMVQEQGLVGRQVPDGWRFLKPALQGWLKAPHSSRKGILAHVGAFKDDPTLEGMVEETYRRRGQG